MDTLTTIGTICSIIGVPIALWQSISAKSKAKAAQAAVDAVLEKNQLSIYAEIISQGHKVENILNTQRGLSKPKFGAKFKTAAKEIDAFITILNEKKNNFTDSSHRDKVNTSLTEINKARKEFNDENQQLSQLIERVLQHTQIVISITAEEKQNKEYKK